jgi:hypothetical protein
MGMDKTGNAMSWRFVTGAVVAVIGLAGCSSTRSSPSAAATAVPSATASAIASPTVAPPALTPSPSPTSRPLTFVATGSMHVARSGATATLLKNGKVLMAGGTSYPGDSSDANFYASAEIYDPATGKFSSTGSMTAARTNATAIRLSDGRILIAGGDGCSDPKHCTKVPAEATENLASAEIYDPATGKFTRTGSMTSSDRADAAVLLPDGRVMMAFAGPAAELFDPATGKFTSSGRTGTSPPNTATLLPNGKVLVTTGEGSPQLYDMATGKFKQVSLALPPGTPTAKYKDGVPVERTSPDSATLLPDGRVLLFAGGYLETYDPATGACADAGVISPNDHWLYPTTTLLMDGRVLFAGGALGSDPTAPETVDTNMTVVYDPSNGHVSNGAMHTARAGQTATLLPNGSVLIAGGEATLWKSLASAELFKP